MAITNVAQGGASAVTTATAPAYPAGIAANDLLLLFVSSDASGIGSAPAGWTALGSVSTGGGMSCRVWARTAVGTESGTQTVSVTGGTKGAAWIAAYRPDSSANTLTPTLNAAFDTDSSSTAISATGSSWTSTTGDMIIACVAMLAASGSFTGNATGVAVSQAGASVTSTARFAGRTGTNTVYYGHADALVTSGGTGTPAYNATAAGANASGVVALIRLDEVANTAPTANAGTDQTAASGATVTLNGTGSSDPDGTIASYAWTQVSGTTVTLSSSSAAQPTFTAPTGPATLVFGLTVTDDDGAASTQDQVTITVTAATNDPPTVTADLATAEAGEVVTFTGSDPDGTIVSWVASGMTPAPTLSGSGGTRTMIAPPRLVDTLITVTVTDDDGATDSVDVLVKASPVRVFYSGSWQPAYVRAVAP